MFLGLYLAFRSEGTPIYNLASNTMYALGLIWIFYDRYLINANKIYRYHIVAKSIYYTLHDDMPEFAFTTMRGLAG
jgi:hypothetical protein